MKPFGAVFVLAALLCSAATMAFPESDGNPPAKHRDVPDTLEELFASPMANHLNVAELGFSSGFGGPSCNISDSSCRRRRLQIDSDGPVPHTQHLGAFVGVTTAGFTDLRYNIIVLNTTHNTDDFLDLVAVAGVALECVVPEGAERPYYENATLVRDAVVLQLVVPSALVASSPEVAAALEEFKAQVLVTHALVLGPATILASPAFRKGGSCSGVIAPTATHYIVMAREEAEAVREPSPDAVDAPAGSTQRSRHTVLAMELFPARLQDLLGGANITFEHDPDAEREVGRRRQLSLALPDNIDSQLHGYREHRRRLSINAGPTPLFDGLALNWDPAQRRAINRKMRFLPGDLLYCQDCYAYFDVRYSIKISACLKINGGYLGVPMFDTTHLTKPATSNWYYSGGWTPDPQLPDCAEIGLADPSTGSWFDFGFKVDARIVGAAGVQVLVKSDGIDYGVSSCPSPDVNNANYDSVDITDSSCVKEVLPTFSLGRFSLAAAGIPIWITAFGGMSAGGKASAYMYGRFQAGFNASVSLELGAVMSMASKASPLETDFIKTFDTSYYAYPYILEGFNSFTGKLDSDIYPVISLTVMDTVPIYFKPRFRGSLAVTLSWGRRLDGLVGSPSLGPLALGHKVTAGAASNSRDLIACGTGGSFSASYSAGLAVGCHQKRFNDIKFIGDIADSFTSLARPYLPTVVVVPELSYPEMSITGDTELGTGCMVGPTATSTQSSGWSPSGTPTPLSTPPPTPSTSPTTTPTPSTTPVQGFVVRNGYNLTTMVALPINYYYLFTFKWATNDVTMGTRYTITITPLSGDQDLYVYDTYGNVNYHSYATYKSEKGVGQTDAVTITSASSSGWWFIEVVGYASGTFRIEVVGYDVPTATATATSTATSTSTLSGMPSVSATPSPSASDTPSQTPSPTDSATPSSTSSPTSSPSTSRSSSPSGTGLPSPSSTNTAAQTPSSSHPAAQATTAASSAATSNAGTSALASTSSTSTGSPTGTPTPSLTPSPSQTPTVITAQLTIAGLSIAAATDAQHAESFAAAVKGGIADLLHVNASAVVIRSITATSRRLLTVSTAVPAPVSVAAQAPQARQLTGGGVRVDFTVTIPPATAATTLSSDIATLTDPASPPAALAHVIANIASATGTPASELTFSISNVVVQAPGAATAAAGGSPNSPVLGVAIGAALGAVAFVALVAGGAYFVKAQLKKRAEADAKVASSAPPAQAGQASVPAPGDGPRSAGTFLVINPTHAHMRSIVGFRSRPPRAEAGPPSACPMEQAKREHV